MHKYRDEKRAKQHNTTKQRLRHTHTTYTYAHIQKHYKSIEAKVLNKLHFKRCCIRSHVPTIENCVHSTILFSFNHQASASSTQNNKNHNALRFAYEMHHVTSCRTHYNRLISAISIYPSTPQFIERVYVCIMYIALIRYR